MLVLLPRGTEKKRPDGILKNRMPTDSIRIDLMPEMLHPGEAGHQPGPDEAKTRLDALPP